MAGDSKHDGEDVTGGVSSASTETEVKSTKKKKQGLFSRTFNALFRSSKDDYEKRLEHISKEEAVVRTRMRKRAQNWRRIIRNFIILSVLSETVAIIYAIMTTRTVEMHWRIRAARVSPMFLIPGLSFLIHSALSSLNTMFNRKDEKTLERLKSERQAKLNELKEKTNYYITQQLIQRYDTDPDAQAAATRALAIKLGEETDQKIYMVDDPRGMPTGQSTGVEVVPPNGVRKRNKGQPRPNTADAAFHQSHEDEMFNQTALDGSDVSQYQQLVVEHHPQTGPNASDGGWLARLAALLVGEDPTQSYALICGNCRMHNGLARKEDFPYITYYCPHCKALNRPKQTDQRLSESNSPHLSSSTSTDLVNTPGGSIVEVPPFSPSPGGSISEVPPSSPSATISSTLPAAATTSESSSIVSDDPIG